MNRPVVEITSDVRQHDVCVVVGPSRKWQAELLGRSFHVIIHIIDNGVDDSFGLSSIPIVADPAIPNKIFCRASSPLEIAKVRDWVLAELNIRKLWIMLNHTLPASLLVQAYGLKTVGPIEGTILIHKKSSKYFAESPLTDSLQVPLAFNERCTLPGSILA